MLGYPKFFPTTPFLGEKPHQDCHCGHFTGRPNPSLAISLTPHFWILFILKVPDTFSFILCKIQHTAQHGHKHPQQKDRRHRR